VRERTQPSTSAGFSRLDNVPLHDLELEVNAEALTFRVREELY
jgi:hypothetical protein